MGYTLIIGEASFDGCKDDLYMRVWARNEAHDAAPTFPNDGMTSNGNSRSPSYTGWSNFCRGVGIYDIFFGIDGRRDPFMRPVEGCYRETPILSEHPGFAVLGPQDVLAFNQALDRHVLKYGELVPGFRPWDEREEDAPENATACASRARLMWLCYWTEWAVANCEWPVLANS